MARETLHTSIIEGRVDYIKHLLDRGTDINSIDSSGSSALYSAVKQNSFEIVELLLEKNADVDKRNSLQLTPLHRACMDKRTEIVELLIKNGANVNLLNPSTGSAVHIATLYRDVAILDLLLAKKPNLNLVDKQGRTAIHLVALVAVPSVTGRVLNLENSQFSTVIEAWLAIAERLLANGADPNICIERTGETPLHIACQRHLFEIMKLLAEYGADSNLQDKNGRTGLHMACEKGFADIVEYLLQEGANSSITDSKKNSALISACQHNHRHVIDVLLRYGVDVTIKNCNEQTALHCACANNASVEILHNLIVCGADVNLIDNDGNSPLHLAAKYNHHQQILKLLAHGARINNKDRQGKTAIHIACQQGHRESVRVLLAEGSDLHVTDDRGRSILHQVCEAGFVYLDLVKTILDHDPNIVKLTDMDGRTALHVACQAKLFNDGTVALLVKACSDVGTDLRSEDKNKLTAFDLMLRNFQRLLPLVDAQASDRAMNTGVSALDNLADAGAQNLSSDAVTTTLLTSQCAKLNELLLKTNCDRSTGVGSNLFDHLMRQNPLTMDLLVNCGYRLDSDTLRELLNDDQSDPVYTNFSCPPTLLVQCRNSIRKALRQRKGSLKLNVHQLPLPLLLLNYINYQ